MLATIPPVSPVPDAVVFEPKLEHLERRASLVATIPPRKVSVDGNTIFTDLSPKSIMHTVQMSRIFQDSKTFVDMKINTDPAKVLEEFNSLMTETSDAPSREQLRKFVATHFTLANQMEEMLPEDWQENPEILQRIQDPHYRQFADGLNRRWKSLTRKIDPDVAANPDRYTLIYLPYPAVVPGGRFREVYYWDSFWIIRGLILSEMFDTVKGMLLNFVHMIRLYGLIPNGGRTYYTNRSQPPLFIQMVKQYVDATGDVDFVRQNMQYMMAEFDYWLQNHFVTVEKNGIAHRLARFNCEDNGPRPESYFEDYDLASHYTSSTEERTQMYWELKTGAETGWDYSTRWMVAPKGESNSTGHPATTKLQDTKARSIVPVDLNAILEKNARILSEYAADILIDQKLSIKYKEYSNKLTQAIDAVLWNDRMGVWVDYDLMNDCQRETFIVSNFFPLWTGSMLDDRRTEQSRKAVDYFASLELDKYAGGAPTTFTYSGQQWDFPNCWPPLEHMLVQGLENTGLDTAKELAYKLASKRVLGCYNNFLDKGHMFEKYDASHMMRIGGGGEYEIQIGFGWTNGVVLDFLNMHGSRLDLERDSQVHRTDSLGNPAEDSGVQNKKGTESAQRVADTAKEEEASREP